MSSIFMIQQPSSLFSVYKVLGPLIDHKNIFLDSTDFIGDMDYEVSSDKFPTNLRILIFHVCNHPYILSPELNVYLKSNMF